jgi:ATP-dependent Lon protease
MSRLAFVAQSRFNGRMAEPASKESVPAPAGVETVPVLPVLPLNDVVLFPGMVAPLVVNTERSMRVVREVGESDRMFLAVHQRDGSIPDDKVEPAQLHTVGCLARMIRTLKFPDDTVRILVQGETRCRITGFEPGRAALRARFELMREEPDKTLETDALARTVSQRFQEIITLSPTLPEELKIALFNVEDSGRLADLVAFHLRMSNADRQALLEELRVRERLSALLVRLNREHQVLKLGSEIDSKVSATFTRNQREHFLREQIRTIRQELGDSESDPADQERFRKRLAAAHLSKEAEKVARKEMERLDLVPPMSPEYGVIQTYLDWLLELPWARETEDRLDLDRAKRVLDRDHYGMARVKDRILEYLAVLQLKRDLKGPILCFVGPPGVGKTSLGQSIAQALGRKFIRMSLGGVRDEAEIRGHRRTYIGAMPGRILQGLRRSQSRNPVFMLDEVDKIGMDFRGDPASALLEVLDPEQNFAFTDHYLDVPFDLSRVLFITTANMLDTIPPPLRDRMEVLELAGYTAREKLRIAERHLLRKQIAAHGLKKGQAVFMPPALERMISEYTREAGVRNLEREIARVCRKIARSVASGRRSPTRVTPERLRGWLGPRRYENELAERRLAPGVATGLAWTPTGGDLLFLEAARLPGKGRLILTGSLGEVMKESAQAAVSIARARGAAWGWNPETHETTDLHIHVPAGSIPKDGPSAGLALTAAVASLLTGVPLPEDVAMTGEITLRGRILPVGGVKEKVLAAARAGIRRVVLPARNRGDLSEIPADIRRSLAFTFVRDIDSALAGLLKLPIRPARPRRPAGKGRR